MIFTNLTSEVNIGNKINNTCFGRGMEKFQPEANRKLRKTTLGNIIENKLRILEATAMMIFKFLQGYKKLKGVKIFKAYFGLKKFVPSGSGDSLSRV